MKLRNKKTGEVADIDIRLFGTHPDRFVNSIAELNEEWEDYDNLAYWYIDSNGDILFSDLDGDQLWEDLAEERKAVGNYFETKEEAERAVEKLQAWKRLRDNGFKFIQPFVARDPEIAMSEVTFRLNNDAYNNKGVQMDIELLFGGEDE